ncbi:translation initiation factor IF-3 [Sulfidibacter corallicola]|uniref:Translation initiation factor IF-3 n=1 Tax=Sulfidibacter corallicola TaxID=2818388 RepID=A0A8A4TDW2_SULCO|nr:translation initiation factor IF-3 [Sulfidibacter corallicola]QTD47833.1 translation initiation factor IF-3 [Sulfidibacter corallicola]
MRRNTKDTQRVNEAIRANVVRVIKSDGDQAGIMNVREALSLAAEEGLDLVEIAPNSDPPVCKIMNFGKYKFQQSKKAKDAKVKQKHVQVKEVKFRPRIDEHDFQTKVRHIRKFIGQGDKVRVFVHFRGREMAHRELGARLLGRVLEETQDIIQVEKHPSMEGNQMAMIVVGQEALTKGKAPKGKADEKSREVSDQPGK